MQINQIPCTTNDQGLPSCLLNNAVRPRLASVSCLRGRPNVGLVSIAVVCALSRWLSEMSREGSRGGMWDVLCTVEGDCENAFLVLRNSSSVNMYRV